MNAPIRQHWVPKVYLRSFCAEPRKEEQIYVYDLFDGRSFRASLDKIAVKRNLYTLGINTEQPSYAVEECLAKLESAVRPLIIELIETETLFEESAKRELFAQFLATLLMRSRQGLQMIYGHREELLEKASNGTLSMSERVANEIFSLSADGMRELFAKSAVALARPLSLHILGLHWRLVRAVEDYFVTSENPLVIYNENEERWGLSTPGSHIHLAISPKLIIHFGSAPSIPGEGTFCLPADGVRGLNGLTLLSAERYLMSHKPFDSLAELLEDREPGSKREFGPAPLGGFE